MRTNIMMDVLKLTGIKSKREALEQELRTLLALKEQEKGALCGKAIWSR